MKSVGRREWDDLGATDDTEDHRPKIRGGTVDADLMGTTSFELAFDQVLTKAF